MKTKEERTHHWNHDILTITCAMCPPAIRTYWITAWDYGDEFEQRYPLEQRYGFSVHTVLAIRSSVQNTYLKQSLIGEFAAPCATHQDYMDENWEFDCVENRCDAVIQDDEFGLIGTSDELMQDPHNRSKAEFLFCPWDYETARDYKAVQERGLQLVAELKEDALERSAKPENPTP